MSYCIDIQDLAGNALIELVEKAGERTVLFSQLNDYGDAIISKLESENIDVSFVHTKEKVEQFFETCSDVFLFEEVGNDIKVILKSGVLIDTLRERFRVPIAFRLLKAFVADSTLKTLR